MGGGGFRESMNWGASVAGGRPAAMAAGAGSGERCEGQKMGGAAAESGIAWHERSGVLCAVWTEEGDEAG